MAGLIYPFFDLPKDLDAAHYKSRAPVAIERHVELRDAVRSRWQTDLPLLPGLEFGKAFGQARGKMTDFVWNTSWDCFVSRAVLEKLTSSGFNLIAVEAKVQWSSPSSSYLEIGIDAFLELKGESWTHAIQNRCSVCGRVNHGDVEIDSLQVDPSSIPNDRDIFRIKDWPTYVMVSERLARAMQRLHLTGIQLQPFPLT